jgi:hypothetical protein
MPIRNMPVVVGIAALVVGIAALVVGAALLLIVGPMVGLFGPGDALGIAYVPALLGYLAGVALVVVGIWLLAKAAHRRSGTA